MALGYAHPDYLLENLTAKQLTQWEAYSLVEPFGSKIDDNRFGAIVSAIYNVNLKKGAQPFVPDKIFPDRTKIFMTDSSKPKQSVDQMKTIMMGLVR